MSRKRYAGYTLIELSITMTVGSTLMILSVGLIHQAMRYHSVTRDRSNIAYWTVSAVSFAVIFIEPSLLRSNQTEDWS